MTPVTDPDVLAQLEPEEGGGVALKQVTDRKVLAQLETPDPTEGMSVPQKVAAGAGKAVVDLYRGAKQVAPIAAEALPGPFKYAGRIGNALRIMMTGDTPEAVQAEIDESRRLDAPLMATNSGKVGNIGTKIAAALAIPGGATYTGATAAGAGLGLLEPTTQGESRLQNSVVGGAAGALGKVAGDKVTAAVSAAFNRRVASEAAREAADASRNATLSAARSEGYVVPPSQANPTAINKAVESLAGKISTAQGASAKNQEVTNRLTRLGLGLKHDEPITVEALKGVRAEAGKAYEKIAKGKFAADETYIARIDGLAAAQKKLAAEFPELASKDVVKIAESMKKDQFDGRTLIELTKALRDKATVAYRSGETEVGRFFKGAAREVEDLMERNIAYTGHGGPKALENFREARKAIAKSYAAEAALNPATGHIDAHVFAAAVKKGKPLADEFKKVGEFAAAFPKASQTPTKTGSVLPGSPLDWIAATGMSAASGNPALMATVMARPVARAALLSKLYQSAMTTPSYGPGAVFKAANAGAQTEIAKRIAQAVGIPAALEASR